jgi:hypothetical protein
VYTLTQFDVIIRKIANTENYAEYRIVALNVLATADEILSHRDTLEIIGDNVVRLEAIDRNRWTLKVYH